MENISLHISYKEATHSDVGKRLNIDNTPNEKQLQCMQDIATRVFEPLREYFGVPIYISSFFRSKALNKAIKGATGSQHMKGQAMDIDADNSKYGFVTNGEIFDYIRKNLVFDQLILENVSEDGTGGWVHVSLNGDSNRGEVLTMKIIDNKKVYERFK